MASYGVMIAGTGSFVPENVVTNTDLERMVETSDEWIRTRTGIRERRIAAEDQTTSDLGAAAAQRAMEAAGVTAEDIDMIIVGTISPDNPFPNTACHVQRKIGARKAACFALEAACSGFLYSTEVAAAMIRTGAYKNILVIGAEKLSSIVDWTDRNTCVLFGDGAGAVVLQPCEPENDMLLGSHLGADGNFTDILYQPAGGCRMPISENVLEQRLQFLKMTGREVFKLAVGAMVDSCEKVLRQAEVTIDNVRWLVPHQANTRIIHAIGKRLEMPREKVFINLDKFGNTSAATIPICLDEITRNKDVVSGDYVLLTAFGGGLTWGAMLLRMP